MSKRWLTLMILSTLMLALAPAVRTIKASPSGGQRQQAKTPDERILREAGQSAL
jgi:hypothetical protein